MPAPPRPIVLSIAARARWSSAPSRLARLHHAAPVGARLALTVTGAAVPAEELRDLVIGAGFVDPVVTADRGDGARVHAVRARTLPDSVGAGMALLVCGLNPSLNAADAGVGFARPGNRFWPAALAAGIVTRDRDPIAARRDHGIGMTDLVKRASVGAAELTAAEYREGAARVERLVGHTRPRAICFVGLAGYRAAVDRHARPGTVEGGFGGVPAYVMPNPSGLNASSSLADLTAHLRRAATMRPPAGDGGRTMPSRRTVGGAALRPRR